MYDLLILGFFVFITLIGFIFYKRNWEEVGVMLMLSGVLLIVGMATGWAMCSIERTAEIRKLEASIVTIEQCMENDDHITNAALSVKIAEINEYIAYGQYCNRLFDMFWPDKIDEIELIEIKPNNK